MSQGEQEVFGADAVVLRQPCFLLRQHHHSATAVSETLKHRTSPPGLPTTVVASPNPKSSTSTSFGRFTSTAARTGRTWSTPDTQPDELRRHASLTATCSRELVAAGTPHAQPAGMSIKGLSAVVGAKLIRKAGRAWRSATELGGTFVIIFGFRSFVKTLAMLTVVCHRCGNPAAHRLIQRNRWFTLFFVPLIPLSFSRHTICTFCGVTQKVSKQDAEQMVAASQQPVAPLPAEPGAPVASDQPNPHRE